MPSAESTILPAGDERPPARVATWFTTVDVVALVAFVAWAAACALRWRANKLFEDQDSISYLGQVRAIRSGRPEQFLNLGADATPAYPVLGALFSLPGWSVETGARLVSFSSSLALFGIVSVLGRNTIGRRGTTLGLCLLVVNSALIDLSSAVLSEPLYIALVYAVFMLFWLWHASPTPLRGATLGALSGLAFLDRTEGILLLAGLPVLQASHLLLERATRCYGARRASQWAIAYVAAFALLAAPQIWNASRQAHRVVINGRQIWSAIMSDPRGRTHEEVVYGLDYSPSRINLDYVMAHPQLLEQRSQPPGAAAYLRLVARNAKELRDKTLDLLVGRTALVLAVFGLVVIAVVPLGDARTVNQRRFKLVFVAGFFGLALAGPLLHNVVVRHVAIIVPLLLLLAGAAIADAAARLTSGNVVPARLRAPLELAAMSALMIGSLGGLRGVLRPDGCNGEYCAAAYEEPVRLLRQAEAARGHPVGVATRRSYVAQGAGVVSLNLPHTTTAKLVEYLKANKADFLFIEQATLGTAPFYRDFESGNIPSELREIYRARDARGRALLLYAIERSQ